MQFISLLLIVFMFNLNFCFAKEILFDTPIDLLHKQNCTLEEFCKEFINDVDIEEFIKNELKNDYVVISLDECLDVALKNNFDIQIQDKIYQSSKYEYQNSLSKFLPILTTTSYISDYRGQILVGGVLRDKFHETAISVNITAQHDLTQGGKTIFQARAAKYLQKSNRHNLHYKKSEIIYLTIKNYYETLLNKIYIEIYLRNLIERNAQLTLAKKLENSGFGTKFDVIRSKNESSLARAELMNALNNFRLSQASLANLMGINVETPLMPFETDISLLKLIDDEQNDNDLFTLAKEFREDLKAYNDIIKYEKQVKNVLLTDFVPKPVVNFQQQFQGTIDTSINPNYIISGLIYWQPGENVFFGTMSKIKSQNEQIKRRILEYQNKFRNIQESIVSAKSSSIFNFKKMEINKNRVEYTKQGVKLAILRFNNGKGILLDVIQAQSQATLAKVELANSIAKYNISQAELLFECGIIDVEKIIKNYKP